jgi:hypothetical protein
MTDKLREAASWRKQKTPLVREYAKDHGKLLSEIAGRGFLNLPGYAYDMENELELRLKLGLSEINYKILSETIERELKQAGITYDLAYKTALITWETEKQGLMTDWDAELAGIKQGMAADENVKALLALEVAARQATLIAAKTAIEEEMEGYKLQLAELDDDTAAYEVQLANAKLLTAQRKLAVIPILQEILEKEEELLGIEALKAAEYTELLNAKQEVANKKDLLLPGYQELANVTQEHASLIPSQILMEQQIADEKLRQAQAEIEKEQNKLSELEINIDTANVEVETGAAKRDLQEEKFANEQELINLNIENDNTFQNEVGGFYDRTMDDDRENAAYLNNKKIEINDIDNDTKYDNATTITKEQMSAASGMATDDAEAIERIAEIKAAANITARLTHLIG